MSLQGSIHPRCFAADLLADTYPPDNDKMDKNTVPEVMKVPNRCSPGPQTHTAIGPAGPADVEVGEARAAADGGGQSRDTP